MTKFYSIDGKHSQISFASFITNMVFYVIIEAIIFAVKVKIYSSFVKDTQSLLAEVINYILIIQAVILLIVIFHVSFRQKGVFVCNDYVEIIDGLIILRLLYRRKIYFHNIKDCSNVKRREMLDSNSYIKSDTGQAVFSFVIDFIFKSIFCFEPFPTDRGDKVVGQIVTSNQKTIVLSIEQLDDFVVFVHSKIKNDK